MQDISIRPAQESYLDAIWDIFHFHLEAGETYPFDALVMCQLLSDPDSWPGREA